MSYQGEVRNIGPLHRRNTRVSCDSILVAE